MNKASDKLHQMFLKGAINGAVFEYMYKMANQVDNEDYTPLILEHTQNIESLGIKSAEGCKDYFSVYTKCPKVIERLAGTVLSKKQLYQLCKMAFVDGKPVGDEQLDKLALDFIKENDLVKNSYPNTMGLDGSGYVSPQYNIEKWIETLRTIYNASTQYGKSMTDATKEITANWPVKERINFERWMKFYQEGQKYNVKTASVTKEAQQYQYVPRAQMGQIENIMNPPPVQEQESEEDKKDEMSKAVKKKLRGRLTSMDKILYEYGDVFPDQDLRELVSIIKNLDDKIRFLHLKASITNCLIRGANQLQKRGFVEGAKELNKIAQEVETDTLPEAPAGTPAAEAPQPAAVKSAPVAKDMPTNIQNINAGGDQEIDMPNFDSSTIKDALSKLEEVNKVISERNVIRALSAVDIMLGQLGIGSYFPKLSEAQLKLMEAFNYAGTRVAEVIGQMRGGQSALIPPPQKEPEKDTVEVTEDLGGPVSNVVPGAPQAEAPAAPTSEAPAATPEDKSKKINVTR